jgi:hypothetical protein
MLSFEYVCRVDLLRVPAMSVGLLELTKGMGLPYLVQNWLFVLCLWPALLFLKSCTKRAGYRSKIKIGCSPSDMIILWAGCW